MARDVTHLQLVVQALFDLAAHDAVRLGAAAAHARQGGQQHGGVQHALLPRRLRVAHAIKDEAGDGRDICVHVAFDGEVHCEEEESA